MIASDVYNVKVLEKAISILNCFTLSRPEWSIKEFCTELKLNRTTVYRILSTLSAHGYINVSDETGKYKLGMAIVAMSSIVLNEMDLLKYAKKYLYELSVSSGETAHLAIYENYKVTLVAAYDSPQEIKATSPIGTTSLLHTSSIGKIFLASFSNEEINEFIDKGLSRMTQYSHTSSDEIFNFVEKIRAEKIAFDFGETSGDRVGIAAPILNYNNKIIASISAVGPKARVETNLELIVSEVKKVAFMLSKDMGYLGNSW